MVSVPLFMRQIVHMTPRHTPNKGVDINPKISVLYIYRIIEKYTWSRREDNT